MYYIEVMELYGKQKIIALLLNISQSAVSQWKEGDGLVSEKQAMRLSILTKGALKYRPELYVKKAA